MSPHPRQKRKHGQPPCCAAKRIKPQDRSDRITDTINGVIASISSRSDEASETEPLTQANAPETAPQVQNPPIVYQEPDVADPEPAAEQQQNERMVPENANEMNEADGQNALLRVLDDQSQTVRSDAAIAQDVVESSGQEAIRQQALAPSNMIPPAQNDEGVVHVGEPVQPPPQGIDDPLIRALDEIAPGSTRISNLNITHNMTRYQIDMMEQWKLPDDVTTVQYPKVGTVQLLKTTDESMKVYEGVDLLDGRFVTVRQLERAKHMRRLRLASRLSLPLGDLEEFRRINELLIPAKTTYTLKKEKTPEGETKLCYYWIEPPNHGSLHAYVIERKRLSEMESKEYFRQICQIVEFCHARAIVIRDLKLRKFVFADAKRQTVKLDDLDETAICPENKADPDLIDYDEYDPDNDLLCDRHGCPAYVSPEILDLSKRWYSGKAADVWSLGVLLYVLLVGRYPFYDVTPAGLFTKIRQARIHLSESDGVRLETRLLVRCLLRRDPKERPSLTEILAHPWLKPKDYRSDFKNFDSIESVFWKAPDQRPAMGGPLTAALVRTPVISQPVSAPRTCGATAQQPMASRPSQTQARDVNGGAKVIDRLAGNRNGGNRQGGDF